MGCSLKDCFDPTSGGLHFEGFYIAHDPWRVLELSVADDYEVWPRPGATGVSSALKGSLVNDVLGPALIVRLQLEAGKEWRIALGLKNSALRRIAFCPFFRTWLALGRASIEAEVRRRVPPLPLQRSTAPSSIKASTTDW